jgi:thiol-disulfide isomerase/thioredoxin
VRDVTFVSRFTLLIALLAVIALSACQFPAGVSQLLGQDTPTLAPPPSAYPEPEQLIPYPGGKITPYPGDEATPILAEDVTPYPGDEATTEPSQSGATPYPDSVAATPEPEMTGSTPYPELASSPGAASTRTAVPTASATPSATATLFTNLFPLAQGAYPQPTGETPYPALETPTQEDTYPGPGAASPVAPSMTVTLGPGTTPGASVSLTPSPPLAVPPGGAPGTATLTLAPTQTPYLTPTPTLTATPTRTLTPLPPPPWVSAQLHATDPRTVRLASGKVQLVEFFAFWSGPSQAMAPIVQGLEPEYRNRMNFVYLDIDDPATRIFQSQLGFRTEPHFFLLDAQGHILQQWVGYVTPAQFRQAFDAALAY